MVGSARLWGALGLLVLLGVPAGAVAQTGPGFGEFLGTHSLEPGVRNVALDTMGRPGARYPTRLHGWALSIGPMNCGGERQYVPIPRRAEVFIESDQETVGPALRIRRRRFRHVGSFVRQGHFSLSRKVDYRMRGRLVSRTVARGTASVTVVYNTFNRPGEGGLRPVFGAGDLVCRSGTVRWTACWRRSERQRKACFGTPAAPDEVDASTSDG